MCLLQFVFVREPVLEHLVEVLLRFLVFLEVEEAWDADFRGASCVNVGVDVQSVYSGPDGLAAAVAQELLAGEERFDG